MVSLFFSRAVSRLFPDCEDIIRISLCVNQRPALKAPLAHQSLVGSAMLEFKKKLRSWNLEKQSTAYRGMVFAQTQEENVLKSAAGQKSLAQKLLNSSDTERKQIADFVSKTMTRVQTATVSYVGKANYKDSESYIRDFRTWTIGEVPLLIEISAVNGRFTLDFIQHFSSPVYVNAFLNELDMNHILFDLQAVERLRLPEIKKNLI